MCRLLKWVMAIIAVLAILPPAHASNTERAAKALLLGQAALGSDLPDIALTDSAGNHLRLSQFRGKPLLLTLVYTSCADVCPTLIETLYPAVKEARAGLGEDSFSVLTVGFDVRNDTPERMRLMASARGINIPNWHFLSADAPALDALARATGFAFYARAGGFDHPAQVSIVNAEGKLVSQVYGAVFEPPVIVEPLKDLVFGRFRPVTSVQGVIDRIKLFCTVYDPKSGRYIFDYSMFVGMGIGIGCLGLVLAFLVREWRRPGPGQA